MMRITERVWRLTASGYAHVYLVLAQKPTLIDSGFTWDARRIWKELKRSGYGDIGAVVLTHHDPDHAGGARWLQNKTGAPVYAGEEDLPFFYGATKTPAGKNLTCRLSGLRAPADLRPMPRGHLLGIEIIPAPGHTPGHTVFRFDDVLFCGDLFSSKGCQPGNMTSYHTDPRRNADSLRGLLDADARFLCPAHGNPLENTPRLREELRRLTEEYYI